MATKSYKNTRHLPSALFPAQSHLPLPVNFAEIPCYLLVQHTLVALLEFIMLLKLVLLFS